MILKNIYNVIFFSLLIFSSSFSQNITIQNQLRLASFLETENKLEEAQEIYQVLYKQSPQNHQIYSLLNTNYIKQKKYDASLELITKQINSNESNISYYGDLGTTYFIMGDEEKALEVWDNALKIDPQKHFNYRIIANYLIENRFIEKAIEVLEKGNEVYEKDHTIFSIDIANLYSLTMKFEEATKEYCKLILQKPNQYNLFSNRIFQYLNLNNAEDPTINAVEDFYEETDNTLFLQLLADLYSKTDHLEKALDKTIELESLTTNNGSSIFNFARKASQLSAHKIASRAYEIILTDYPNSVLVSEAEIGFARELEAQLEENNDESDSWKPLVINKITNSDKYFELIKTYAIIKDKYPSNKIGWEAEYRIAKIYFEKLDSIKIAAKIFNKIIEDYKSADLANKSKFNLAKIYAKENRLNEAKNNLEEIVDRNIKDKSFLSDAIFYLGKINLWQGEFTKAINIFSEVASSPNNKNANDALSYNVILNTFKNDSTNLFSIFNSDYLVEKNIFIEAKAEFRKLYENKNLFILRDFAALKYAELLLALNNYKEAVILLQELTNSDNNNIYKDRFLFLQGALYYYGFNNDIEAQKSLITILDDFPNSIYYSKARKIITEINLKETQNL